MGKITIIFSAFIFLALSTQIKAQSIIPNANEQIKEIEMPFERHGNYIILKVEFKDGIPLRFLFDTGAEHTILAKKEIAQMLNVRYDRSIDILGSDLHTPIKAYIARHVTIDILGLRSSRDILVLDEDIFQFDKFVGLNIHGILGAEIFRNHIVKIDYNRQVLTVITPEFFEAREVRGYDSFRIEIYKSKPYLNTLIKVASDTAVNLKLLLDTGAGIPLLLYAHSTPGLSPPAHVLASNIGSGLGGTLNGYVGRVNSLKFGNIEIKESISYFQELEKLADTALIIGRSGILGNEILSRFIVIIDFTKSKLYLKRTKDFKDKFTFDRSGISLIAAGLDLNRYFVNNILHNSPADEAGLQENDEILKIGWLPANFYALPTINRILQSRVGKTIKMTVLRGKTKMKFKVKLRDLI